MSEEKISDPINSESDSRHSNCEYKETCHFWVFKKHHNKLEKIQIYRCNDDYCWYDLKCSFYLETLLRFDPPLADNLLRPKKISIPSIIKPDSQGIFRHNGKEYGIADRQHDMFIENNFYRDQIKSKFPAKDKGKAIVFEEKVKSINLPIVLFWFIAKWGVDQYLKQKQKFEEIESPYYHAMIDGYPDSLKNPITALFEEMEKWLVMSGLPKENAEEIISEFIEIFNLADLETLPYKKKPKK